jgi:hypothetical protein
MAKEKITQAMLDADPSLVEQGLKVGDNVPVSGEETVPVPLKTLEAMQKQMADMEIKLENEALARQGVEAILEEMKGADTTGEKKLREKKSFEPKFRTVRLRQYPIGGDETKLGYVVGWTNKGAYQEVDRSGVSPVIVDMIDIIFLGHERNKDGKLQAEKVKLLDLMNKGVQVHCKIIEKKVAPRQEPTGEEIDVTVFDPQHGLIATGDKVDGYTMFSDISYLVQIPGVAEPVWVDGEFVNA